MIRRWEQGRHAVEQLISNGGIERVSPGRELADVLLKQANTHLSTAEQIYATDPEAGFQTAYDAARKALTAILANQGLRAKSAQGAHAVLLEVAFAQLDPPMGGVLRHFRLAQEDRHRAEYPSVETPPVTAEDVHDAIGLARDIVEVAERAIPEMPVF